MVTTRRSFLGQAGAGGLGLVSAAAWAGPSIELPLPGGPRERALTKAAWAAEVDDDPYLQGADRAERRGGDRRLSVGDQGREVIGRQTKGSRCAAFFVAPT